MKARVYSLALVLCAAVLLPAQVGAPKIGVVRYAGGDLRMVFGLAENFVVDRATLGAADAASFSDAGGLIAKNGRIELIGADGKLVAQFDSGERAPVLNVDGALTSAIAWLPGQQALLAWNGKSFDRVEVQSNLLSQVSCVRVRDRETAELLETEEGGTVSAVAVSLKNGEVLSVHLLAGIRGPAFVQQSFVLFANERGLEIAAANGSVRTVPMGAAAVTFERSSSDWVHIASADGKRNWMLRVKGGAVDLCELPAAPQAALVEAAR